MSDAPGRALRHAFARRSVEAMADRRSFERGLLYAANGRVGKPTLTASSVQATVRGSAAYQVRLSLDADGEPAYDCSCPVGQEGQFCKHAVAVALVTTDAVADPEHQAEAVIDVRGYLEGLDRQALVDLLVERAADDGLFDAGCGWRQRGPRSHEFRVRDDVGHSVHLKHVLNDISAAKLVGQWVAARGRVTRNLAGKIIALESAEIEAVDDPAAPYVNREVSTLEAILASAPGPDSAGAMDLDEEEFAAFLRAATS